MVRLYIFLLFFNLDVTMYITHVFKLRQVESYHFCTEFFASFLEAEFGYVAQSDLGLAILICQPPG